jgi:indole-3-glycerol phosphate synthase
MDCLVEVHNTRELDIALIAGAELIGINNRNLEDFEVDLSTTSKLTSHIIDPIPVVGESGIKKPEDIAQMKEAGCRAVLVGETFMHQKDIAQAVRELFRDEWQDRAA